MRDIAQKSDWDSDSYIVKYQPQSLLCWPILDRGNLVGILYLENRLTAGVFTRDRLQLLNLLCSQAGICLQNALLYKKSQDYSQQLERSLEKFSRTEAQLAQQKQMLQAIIDVAPIWIWMINPRGKVQFFNNTLCQDLGVPLSAFLAVCRSLQRYTRGECSGLSGFRCRLPCPRFAALLQRNSQTC